MGGAVGSSIIFGLVGLVMFGRLAYKAYKKRRAEQRRRELRARSEAQHGS